MLNICGKDFRVLWSIGVYSRIDHLKLQQDCIREYFGDKVTIGVFHNGSHNISSVKHKEDIFTHAENSGHHTGTRDSMNFCVQYLSEYDLVINTHADAIFTDYSIVEKIIEKMLVENKSAAFLEKTSEMVRNVVTPYVRVDFSVMTSDICSRILPLTDFCDGDEGIEVRLARKIIDDVKVLEELYVVPCKLIQNPGRSSNEYFANIMNTNVDLLRTNDFDVTRAYLNDKKK